MHEHLTNTLFGLLALWVRIIGYWRRKTPYERRDEGFVASDIDEYIEDMQNRTGGQAISLGGPRGTLKNLVSPLDRV